MGSAMWAIPIPRTDCRFASRAAPGCRWVCYGWVCYAGLIPFVRVSTRNNVRASGKDYGSSKWPFSRRGSDFAGGCEWGGVGPDGEACDLAMPLRDVVEAAFFR